MSPLFWVTFALLALYCLMMIFQLYWALISTFKDDFDFGHNIFGFPDSRFGWQFGNYLKAFKAFGVPVMTSSGYKTVGFFEMLANSVFYCVGCALAAAFVPCIVGYVTAKFRYAFSRILTTVIIICMMLPVIGSMPSEIMLAKSLGMYDSIWGMWIMKGNFFSMYTLIFQAFYRNIPDTYIEAAKVDGASNLRIFIKIMLPLVSKMFLTVVLLNFIGFWNDYQTPLIYMPNHPTLAFGLFSFNRSTDTQLVTVPLKLTGSLIVLLPILILFLCFHKRLIGNLAIGGLKG